ncbi:MAG: tRNA (adenine-N1)-methyltransferase [Thermoplasmata archaeon]
MATGLKKIALSDKRSGIIDEAKREINIDGKIYRYRPNDVIEAGDTLSINGETFVISNYNPTIFYRTIKRVAQIISPQDASYMLLRSGIGRGSSVLEIGVGSGNFSAYILWAIMPSGHLTMQDISDKNIKSAISNLSLFYDTDGITSVTGSMNENAPNEMYDAVFADIPDPWEYMGSISKVMKPGSYGIFYLPNYDQVEKTVLSFKENGIDHIESTEIIKRDLIVRKDATRPQSDMIGHTGFIIISMKRSTMDGKIL